MKRRIDTEVLKLFFEGKLDELDKLPYTIIPKDRTPNRCCIYKERAIVRYRIMALLGIDIERYDDEMKPLSEYAREIMAENPPVLPLLLISTVSAMHAAAVSRVHAWPTAPRMPLCSSTVRLISMKRDVSAAASVWMYVLSMQSCIFPFPVRKPALSEL